MQPRNNWTAPWADILFDCNSKVERKGIPFNMSTRAFVPWIMLSLNTSFCKTLDAVVGADVDEFVRKAHAIKCNVSSLIQQPDKHNSIKRVEQMFSIRPNGSPQLLVNLLRFMFNVDK